MLRGVAYETWIVGKRTASRGVHIPPSSLIAQFEDFIEFLIVSTHVRRRLGAGMAEQVLAAGGQFLLLGEGRRGCII